MNTNHTHPGLHEQEKQWGKRIYETEKKIQGLLAQLRREIIGDLDQPQAPTVTPEGQTFTHSLYGRHDESHQRDLARNCAMRLPVDVSTKKYPLQNPKFPPIFVQD